ASSMRRRLAISGRCSMILAALAAKGGQKCLEKQADENPTAFLTLVGKIIPLQVTGNDGGPIQHQGIDAPAKETREEWLARPAKGEPPSVHLRLPKRRQMKT